MLRLFRISKDSLRKKGEDFHCITSPHLEFSFSESTKREKLWQNLLCKIAHQARNQIFAAKLCKAYLIRSLLLYLKRINA